MKDLIFAAYEDSQFCIKPTPLFMLPIEHTWISRPRVTLIGDAAHLMTPFAGEGVSVTMLDALGLAESIIEVNESESSVRWRSEASRPLRPFFSGQHSGLAGK
jgi:2-polyprenyl-6-methoxyphenol hydroxylase-like FAD-dependent oxidoreductase